MPVKEAATMYEMTQLFLYKFVFIAELLIATYLYSFRCKKRSHFIVRATISSAVCFLLGYLYPVASFSAGYSSIMFFVLFFICAASLIFVYDMPIKQVFFLSVAAYTTQHFAHELYSLIANAFQLVTDAAMGMYGDSLVDFSLSSPKTWFVFLVYIEVYLFSYWFLYRLFGRKINREDVRINNFSVAVMSALILAVDVVLNAVAVYVPDGYSKVYSFLTCTYNLICCMLILYIQVSMCMQKKLEKEVEILSLLLHQSEEQYLQSNENVTLLNLKCHDLKHQIREYGGERQIDEEYIRDIENIVNIYDSTVKTGNDALDLIFTEKSLLCLKNGITLTCLADCSKLNFISDADLYGLFGNIIDNAIEAVTKISDKEKRNINLIVKNVNSFVSVEVDNYYVEPITLGSDGLPSTTKKDKNYHGYGLKSVAMIVDRYDGVLKVSIEKEIFSLSILFPFSKNQ